MRRLALPLYRALCTLALAGFVLVNPAPGRTPETTLEQRDEARFQAFDAAIAKTKSVMMGDPQKALSSARAATAMAGRLPPSKRADIARATAGWLEGEALIGINDSKAAKAVIDQALSFAQKISPGSKLNGDLLRSHGAIAQASGDVVTALKDYQRAFRVFEAAQVPRSEAIALQDIGQIYWEAGDYAKVLDYYRQSTEAFDNDPALNLSTHNNVAEVLRKQGKFAEASREYRAALKEAKALDSPMLEARILANLADCETEAGHLAAAQAVVDDATVLVRRGESAGWRGIVYGSGAKVAAARGAWTQAAALFDRAFTGVDLKQSDMSYHDYHQIASQVYEKVRNGPLALAHLKAFQRLDAEAAMLTASITAQLASAQFDFASQDLRIARLQQERLQRDIALERQRARFRTTLLVGLGAAGSLVLAILLFGYISVRRSRDRVRASNETLMLTNVKLEKALQAKTDFLAMTSHEIRTPLNGILGMTQVLLADGKLAADTREQVDVMNSAGNTMKALVDDILDVAKMESGELTIVQEAVDLHTILREAIQLWRGHAEAKSLDFIVDTTRAPIHVMSDGARIRQIIFNLMSNAMKFTQVGQVSIRVSAEQNAAGANEIMIAVRDTGIGIAPEMQGEIFEAFKQADSGTTRQFSGTGLGLTICRRIAEALGGEISIESAVGAGSTFTVRLPLEHVGDGCGGTSSIEPDEVLGAHSALALLADAAGSVLLKMNLVSRFGQMDFANGASTAFERLANSRFDVVIIDMNELHGDRSQKIKAARAIIAACDDMDARSSLLLTTDGALSVADAMMLGASQIILRPLAEDDLNAALASLFTDEPEMLVAPSLMAVSQ